MKTHLPMKTLSVAIATAMTLHATMAFADEKPPPPT
jgi:hypothetical protein